MSAKEISTEKITSVVLGPEVDVVHIRVDRTESHWVNRMKMVAKRLSDLSADETMSEGTRGSLLDVISDIERYY